MHSCNGYLSSEMRQTCTAIDVLNKLTFKALTKPQSTFHFFCLQFECQYKHSHENKLTNKNKSRKVQGMV